MTASSDSPPDRAPHTPERPGAVTRTLADTWALATGSVRHRRGGERYLAGLFATLGPDGALADFTRTATIWTVGDVDAFMVVRDRVILALYVRPEKRRRGIGRELVRSARAIEPPAHDALVLPGDRAMKSLFESIGWKARLLTLGDG